ncbi:MAG: hypothetical protein WBO36_17205 [Saprospiraceae bacterium]
MEWRYPYGQHGHHCIGVSGDTSRYSKRGQSSLTSAGRSYGRFCNTTMFGPGSERLMPFVKKH